MLCALVRGYHSVHPFSKAELALLYPLLLTRLAVSLVNAAIMKQKLPDDPYVTISEAPALAFLNEACDWPFIMVTRRLHLAAGFPVVDHAGRVLTWLDDRHNDFAPIFATDSSGDLPGDSSFWPRCSCSLLNLLCQKESNGAQPRRGADASSRGHRDTNTACGLLRRTPTCIHRTRVSDRFASVGRAENNSSWD